MDAPPAHPTLDNLDETKLDVILSFYPALIDKLAATENKGGQREKTLSLLDTSRYESIPKIVSLRHRANVQPEYTGSRESALEESKDDAEQSNGYGWINLNELKELMEWKLLRGTFRPSLRGFIASNDEKHVRKITEEAFQTYGLGQSSSSKDDKSHVRAAMKKLCSLKGVGPATASLVLSTAFPQSVPFFSDELYAWAVIMKNMTQASFDVRRSTMQRPSLKYSQKEYDDLFEAVAELRETFPKDRNVSAREIEQAAFVILRKDITALMKLEAGDVETKEELFRPNESTRGKRKRRKSSTGAKPDVEAPPRRTMRTRSQKADNS